MVKIKDQKPLIQADQLPTISRFDLFHPVKKTWLLNPFFYMNLKLRITGYDSVSDVFSIQSVATGEIKEKPIEWLKEISTKK